MAGSVGGRCVRKGEPAERRVEGERREDVGRHALTLSTEHVATSNPGVTDRLTVSGRATISHPGAQRPFALRLVFWAATEQAVDRRSSPSHRVEQSLDRHRGVHQDEHTTRPESGGEPIEPIQPIEPITLHCPARGRARNAPSSKGSSEEYPMASWVRIYLSSRVRPMGSRRQSCSLRHAVAKARPPVVHVYVPLLETSDRHRDATPHRVVWIGAGLGGTPSGHPVSTVLSSKAGESRRVRGDPPPKTMGRQLDARVLCRPNTHGRRGRDLEDRWRRPRACRHTPWR
jgi:hypothetical protein